MIRMRFPEKIVFALALFSLMGQPAVAQDLPSEVTLFNNVNVFDGLRATMCSWSGT